MCNSEDLTRAVSKYKSLLINTQKNYCETWHLKTWFAKHKISDDDVFLSIHTATISLEDYEQAYIVHTGFAG